MLKILALALLVSTPATAAIFDVTLNGTLTSQLGGGDDPNLSVGSPFTLTAQFDGSLITAKDGYSVASLWGLPSTGNSFFRVDAPGMTWGSLDDNADGMLVGGKVTPEIAFVGDKIIWVSGMLSPNHTSVRPVLFLDTLSILNPRGQYGDNYSTPGFMGEWDFANSSIVDPPDAVPEPAAWALLIVGFGAVGFTMRRKRPAPAW